MPSSLPDQTASEYDAEGIAQFFDQYGLREWNRLVETPVDEVNLYLHTHYLEQTIRPGMVVLEIGAGAGRFTQVLARLGARILVADISQGQLDLNRRFAFCGGGGLRPGLPPAPGPRRLLGLAVGRAQADLGDRTPAQSRALDAGWWRRSPVT